MDGSGFLKTVNFGGFDKKDVLNYVDQLNTKIYTLENELEQAKALAESGSGGSSEEKEKYEQLLATDKAKITELQTSNDSLKMQLKNAEDESAIKDKQIEELNKKLADMENELVDAKNKAAAASTGENNAMDLTNVFMEAQRTATTIVTQAKENARKMDEDAKKLANQVVDDANSKASTIVKSADEKASKILTDAEDKSSEMRIAADNMKAVVLAEVKEITANITKLKDVFESLTGESMTKITETSSILSETEATLTKGGIPQFKAPAGTKAAPAPAPAAQRPVAPAPAPAIPKPAPAPAPVQKPAAPAPAPAPAKPAADPAAVAAAAAAKANAANKPAAPKPAAQKFDFDLSEIQKLANAIDAGAGNTKGKPLDDGYDGNVDAKSIKLSDMG